MIKGHILIGRGENCTCYDCVVLYGGECWTTGINNALDYFDQEVYKVIVDQNKKISYYQLYKIIRPILSNIKKDCGITVRDLDNYYKTFMSLMIFSTGRMYMIRDEHFYKTERYELYKYITKDLKEYLKNPPEDQ